MRHEAAQRLDALLLVLWGTARVGAGAGCLARLRERRCIDFRHRAVTTARERHPEEALGERRETMKKLHILLRMQEGPPQLRCRHSQTSCGHRTPAASPFTLGYCPLLANRWGESKPVLCVATWQAWMKPQPGPVLSQSPPAPPPPRSESSTAMLGPRVPASSAGSFPCPTGQCLLDRPVPSLWDHGCGPFHLETVSVHIQTRCRAGGRGDTVPKAGPPTRFPAEVAAVGLGRFAGALTCLHGSLWA